MLPIDSKAEIVIRELTESNLNDEASKRDSSSVIAEAQLALAIACAERGDLAEAKRHAHIAAEQATPDWPHLESLGTLLFQLSEFPKARCANPGFAQRAFGG